MLFDKENSPPNFDVVIFLVPYDVISTPTSDPLPKPTHVAPICVAIDVNKSLAILNVTPMVVAPTNNESPTMMQTSLLHHTLKVCNSKPLGDYVEIVNLPLTIKNLSVPTTKQVVLGKLEGHHGTKIKNMSQMATCLENDPTVGPRNSSQDGNGPKGKNVDGPMKKLKSGSFLLKLHHL